MNQDQDNQDLVDYIAIIGMSTRLPGAPDLKAYWELLRDGREAIVQSSKEELAAQGYPEELINNPNMISAKGFLADADMFDAAFFGISPREAELVDPQHRVMLECAWEAMEHAGYEPSTYPGRVAILTSAGMNSYLALNIMTHPGLIEEIGGFQLSIYNDKDFVPTRIAYSMNTHGPAIDIGTACSSSLVGVHLACQQLLTYQADMVLVGGVTVHFPQHSAYIHEGGSAYSPDGHCRPFDATPSGLVDGNGAASIVLKRLSEAIEDGDHIHAIIRGSAINNDGSDKIGYSAPSIEGQSEVILQAQAAAGVHGADITYIEAHGTATPLGDPIEVAALTQAFRESTDEKSYCGLGSVKSNIGHVDKAAGLAGLIKTVLSLENEKLVPNLHWKAPNPKLDLPNTPFYVVDKLKDWNRIPNKPRFAGISSFGVGGTNSHAILEEAPLRPSSSSSRPAKLIVLSARTETALAASAKNLELFLKEAPDIDLADVAYTLQLGRKKFNHRLAISCLSHSDAIEKLQYAASNYVEQDASSVTFMFTGQGSQYAGMAKGLYLNEPDFKETVDICADLLKPLINRDIRDFINTDLGQKAQFQDDLRNTCFAQPALFVVEYAIAKLWMSWGINPSAMIGHSLGEYVAACIAGVFSLEDALKIVSARSRLMQSMPTGSMMAVSLPEPELQKRLKDLQIQLDIAAINAPALCVVSGLNEKVHTLRESLESQSTQCRILHTSHAFHSAMMEPILSEVGQIIASTKLHAPEIPYVSNLTGSWITAAQATSPQYWLDHLRQAVKFSDGLNTILTKEPHTVLLEIGPGRTLTSLAKMIHASEKSPTTYVSSLPPAEASTAAHEFMTQSLGQLWIAGLPIDWGAYYVNERRLRQALPTYPFERSKFWIEPLNQPNSNNHIQDASRRKNPQDWFYTPVLVSSQLSPIQSEGGKSIILISHDSMLATELSQLLSDQGNDVTRISTNDIDRHSFKNHSAQIIYMPNLNDDIDQCFDLLKLVRLVKQENTDSNIDLSLVVSQALTHGPESVIHPGMASLFGAVKSVEFECPELSIRLIDCIIPGTKKTAQLIANKISNELKNRKRETSVALRPNGRWISQLQPISMDKNNGAQGLLRERGAYLIVGGVSDIGILFADQLAKSCQAKIILTTSDANFDLQNSEYKLKIDQVILSGGEVITKVIPENDSHALGQLLKESGTTFGPILGLIDATDMHAIKPTQTIQNIDVDSGKAFLLKTKNHLSTLKEAIFGHDLDFCMIMSSLTAQIGGIGQFVSSAASSYMQAFVHMANLEENTPWIITQWDSWKATHEPVSSRGIDLSLSPSEGGQAFSLLMQNIVSPCVVIATNPPQLRISARQRIQGDSTEGQSKIERKYERPNLANPYIAPRNEHEEAICDVWQNTLAINRIGVDDNFFDLGGHSLLGVQLTVEIQQKFNTPVDMTMLFAHPTVATLSQALLQNQVRQSDEELLAQQLDQLEQMTDEEVQALLERKDLPPALAKALGLAD